MARNDLLSAKVSGEGFIIEIKGSANITITTPEGPFNLLIDPDADSVVTTFEGESDTLEEAWELKRFNSRITVQRGH